MIINSHENLFHYAHLKKWIHIPQDVKNLQNSVWASYINMQTHNKKHKHYSINWKTENAHTLYKWPYTGHVTYNPLIQPLLNFHILLIRSPFCVSKALWHKMGLMYPTTITAPSYSIHIFKKTNKLITYVWRRSIEKIIWISICTN